MAVPSACSKIIFTSFKFFWACSIFFEHSLMFWSWPKARFYLINLHIWAWSKIFEHIQKILNMVKNIWTWSKNIWTSRWIRQSIVWILRSKIAYRTLMIIEIVLPCLTEILLSLTKALLYRPLFELHGRWKKKIIKFRVLLREFELDTLFLWDTNEQKNCQSI